MDQEIKKLNILFILPEYYPHSGGGISTYYLQHIDFMRSHVAKIKVVVGSAYTQSLDRFLHHDIEVEYLKPDLFHKYLERFKKFDFIPQYKKAIASAWAMWEQVNAGAGFDLVECTDFGLGFIPWLIHHNIPVVTRLHGSSGQIELHERELQEILFGDQCRQTELSLLEKSDALVTHSQSNYTFWQDIFPHKQINLISPLFKANATPAKFIQKENFAIVCSRIQEWKGPDILCRAVKTIAKPVLIKWYGRNTMFTESLSKSDQLLQRFPEVWNHTVIPQGQLSHHQLEAVQKTAKFAIIPSTWDMYNFTCLEYMSIGTPVICSDGAGVSSLIKNGVNGFKYASNDHIALASCIEAVNNMDQSAFEKMTSEALKTVKSLMSTNIINDNTKLMVQVIQKFELIAPNLFNQALYLPSDKKYAIDIVLNQQPLNKLLKYITKRLKKKIFGG
ncbi:glycosyltransferase family 4 protein [Pedobacter roseus]|uniref:Glycosyltransferase family 4 protein n=1 Tax=Pedobacter roseus TaxID=336820 RepID=A0A7G9QI51_9SPHI|nr:glycosyltransferase family 4 protein [Pedobacter roseus]QNN43026.1 glycosyltransferase family 4 protein [Pedobacter roseus]